MLLLPQSIYTSVAVLLVLVNHASAGNLTNSDGVPSTASASARSRGSFGINQPPVARRSSDETAASPGRILTPEIDGFINKILADWTTPGGASVAVVRRNADGSYQVETKGYGKAKLDGSPVNEDTLFSLASNTKLITCLATGLLVSNESLTPRISWQSKIETIFPEWELTDAVASNKSSISDLMSHRTGLPRHDYIYKLDDSIPDLIKSLRHLRPSAEFREKFQYNNLMYSVLAQLPTALLPERPSFAKYVKEHIFDPMGLQSTTFSFDVASKTGKLADPLIRQGLDIRRLNPQDGIPKGIPRAVPFYSSEAGGEDGNSLSGPGGVISNSVDVAKLLQVLLEKGKVPQTNKIVIPGNVIDFVSSGLSIYQEANPFLPFISPQLYGGGQFQLAYRGHVVVEHDGSHPGYTSMISRMPHANIGVAVLTNDNLIGTTFTNVIKWRLYDQALGLQALDTNTYYKRFAFGFASTFPKPELRPHDAAGPSTGFTSLAGKYEHPAYGSIELCYVSSVDSQSEGCKDVAANADKELPGVISRDTPTFVAKWNRAWSSHFTLTHYKENSFNMTLLTSYPTGNSSEPFWAYSPQFGPWPVVEFAMDGLSGGFGITGGFWGAGNGVADPAGNTVQQRSEVWFSKV